MTTNNATMTAINNAFVAANEGYKKRNPEKVEALAGSLQDDLKAGLAVFAKFTEPQLKTLEKLGVNWSQVASGLGNSSNVKIARRLPQFLGFVVSGSGNFLKGSAQTALLEYCALCIGAKTKDALRFASTGKGNESTSDEINTAQARKIQKAFGKVGSSSRETQASVSFSKGGLLDILGMVKPWAKGNTMPELVDCKLGRALGALIASASDSQIEIWASQAKTKAKNK